MVKPPVVLPPVPTTPCDPITMVVGEIFNVEPATMPDNGKACGLPIPLSVKTRFAVRVPVAPAPGLNVTSISQVFPPLARGLVQAGAPSVGVKEKLKSAALVPVMATLEIVRAKSPSLETSAPILALLVPAACPWKAIGFGETCTVAPVPEFPRREIARAPPGALLFTTTCAELPQATLGVHNGARTPGWNVTEMVHVAPADNDAGQLFDSRKSFGVNNKLPCVN